MSDERRALADRLEQLDAFLAGDATWEGSALRRPLRAAAAALRDDADLAEWKASAIIQLGHWDAVYEALGRPGQLGDSMAHASRDEALRLRAEVARLRLHGRAIIARHAVTPSQCQPYEDPERGWVVPVDDPELQHLAFEALSELWALLDTEGADR